MSNVVQLEVGYLTEWQSGLLDYTKTDDTTESTLEAQTPPPSSPLIGKKRMAQPGDSPIKAKKRPYVERGETRLY